MNARDRFLQAYREARANGRIGYSRLNDPRARMAAAEVLRMRCETDELTIARQRRTYALLDAAASGWSLN